MLPPPGIPGATTFPPGGWPPPSPQAPPAPQLATPGARVAAGMIDLGIMVAADIAVAALLGGGGSVDTATVPGALRTAVIQFTLVLAPWIYLAMGWHGRGTVGTRTLGLRVVDEATGTLPTLGQCVRRSAGLVTAVLALCIGIVWMAVDPRRRGWQDLVGGTVVVRRATPSPFEPPVVDPPRNPAEAAELGARRTAWTWTDVVPVLILFYPLAIAASYAVVRGVKFVHPGPIEGTPRAIIVFVLGCVAYGADIAVLAFLVVRRRRRPLPEVGLRLPDLRWLVAAVPLALGVIYLSSVLGVISSALFPNADQTQCKDIRDNLSSLAILTVVSTSVVAPVAEELVFRGFVLGWLLGRMRPLLAVPASAAVFSAAHFAYLQPTLFLPIFGVGLALGLVFTLTRSIWPGAIMHSGLNLLATIVILVHPSC